MKRRKKKKNNFISILIVIIAVIYGLFQSNLGQTYSSITNTDGDNETIYATDIVDDLNTLKVYFLDVGQADAILIQNNGENMLIDAGNNEDGSLLVDYFKQLGIEDFKYLVGTHPHEDHIGGLDNIIESFNINKIYLPDAITTTKTFEDVLNAIDNKNLKYTVPDINEKFSLGNAKFTVIYTGTNTSDLNNSSIVLKMTFGNISFLFTGDATSEVEKQILNKDIKADILKIGHHGSKYSSSENFLNKVNPKYAIISVGKNNSYNHPADSTMSKLKSMDMSVYRTDEEGTILITSDGNNININNFNTNTNGG